MEEDVLIVLRGIRRELQRQNRMRATGMLYKSIVFTPEDKEFLEMVANDD